MKMFDRRAGAVLDLLKTLGVELPMKQMLEVGHEVTKAISDALKAERKEVASRTCVSCQERLKNRFI